MAAASTQAANASKSKEGNHRLPLSLPRRHVRSILVWGFITASGRGAGMLVGFGLTLALRPRALNEPIIKHSLLSVAETKHRP